MEAVSGALHGGEGMADPGAKVGMLEVDIEEEPLIEEDGLCLSYSIMGGAE